MEKEKKFDTKVA